MISKRIQLTLSIKVMQLVEPLSFFDRSRFEVDYFDMPGGNDVNVVNWQTESPVTQTFTDPNNQTTSGSDIISELMKRLH